MDNACFCSYYYQNYYINLYVDDAINRRRSNVPRLRGREGAISIPTLYILFGFQYKPDYTTPTTKTIAFYFPSLIIRENTQYITDFSKKKKILRINCVCGMRLMATVFELSSAEA